tara:strand:- start:2217 stop:3455 length:1239 start_codon:yes stop_codon:yes gene_type:complete
MVNTKSMLMNKGYTIDDASTFDISLNYLNKIRIVSKRTVGNSKCLVVLPGFNDYSFMSSHLDLYEKCFNDYDIFIYSYPNSGAWSLLGDMKSNPDFIEDMDNLEKNVSLMIKLLNISVYESKILMGHSLGGLLAIKLLNSGNVHFDKLILNSPYIDYHLKPLFKSIDLTLDDTVNNLKTLLLNYSVSSDKCEMVISEINNLLNTALENKENNLLRYLTILKYSGHKMSSEDNKIPPLLHYLSSIHPSFPVLIKSSFTSLGFTDSQYNEMEVVMNQLDSEPYKNYWWFKYINLNLSTGMVNTTYSRINDLGVNIDSLIKSNTETPIWLDHAVSVNEVQNNLYNNALPIECLLLYTEKDEVVDSSEILKWANNRVNDSVLVVENINTDGVLHDVIHGSNGNVNNVTLEKIKDFV